MTGYALLIGNTHVDPDAYGGWDGVGGCEGCAKDVRRIEKRLRQRGFDPANITILLNEQATRDEVLTQLVYYSAHVQPGDLFVLYRTGHGGSVLDLSGDEADNRDETWVLWDGELLDDAIWPVLCMFQAGVRIASMMDTCHAQTAYRGVWGGWRAAEYTAASDPIWGEGMAASMIQMGACRDSGTAAGYPDGGAYTIAWDEAWDEADGDINYVMAFVKASIGVRGVQRPTFELVGKRLFGFAMQKVFEI